MGRGAGAHGDARDAIVGNVVVLNDPLAALADEHPRVLPADDGVVHHVRLAILQNGHPRARVGADAVSLHAAASQLGDEDARVLPLLDEIAGDQGRPAAEDGDAGPLVGVDDVVREDAGGVVAEEHAHALRVMDDIVRHHALRPRTFDDHGVPGAGRDIALVDEHQRPARHEHRGEDGRVGGRLVLRTHQGGDPVSG